MQQGESGLLFWRGCGFTVMQTASGETVCGGGSQIGAAARGLYEIYLFHRGY